MFDLANVIHGCTKGLNGNNSSQAIVFFPFCVTAHYSFFGLSGSEKVISVHHRNGRTGDVYTFLRCRVQTKAAASKKK